MLKELCLLNGTSGDEKPIREYIIDKIKNYCSYETDALGSIIAFKKGKKAPNKKVMLCAHMDEVGFIITDIDGNRFEIIDVSKLTAGELKKLDLFL